MKKCCNFGKLSQKSESEIEKLNGPQQIILLNDNFRRRKRKIKNKLLANEAT